jgi:hypothetical protein
MLKDVQGIDTLVSLHTLSIGCPFMSIALDLTKLTSLTDVNLSGCTRLSAVIGINKLTSLISLNLDHCNSLRFPDEPDGMTTTALRTLRINSFSTVFYFQRQDLPVLNELALYGHRTIGTLQCSLIMANKLINFDELEQGDSSCVHPVQEWH